MADGRQTTEEQRLTQDIQLTAEGINQLDELVSRAGSKPFVVGFRGKGVIQ